MTAKEARNKAEAFNLVQNDSVYKKLQNSIQQEASKGKFYVLVYLPDCTVETGDSGLSYYLPIQSRLDKAVIALKEEGFDVTVRPSTVDSFTHEVVIDWSKEEHKA